MSHLDPATDLPGTWERALYVASDGEVDCTTVTTWIQGPTLFVDLRQSPELDRLTGARCLLDLQRDQLLRLCEQSAFAGVTEREGGLCRWRRRLDLHPAAALPDEGTLRWENGALVEEGVHEPYTEYWNLVERVRATAAARLRDPQTGAFGLLVRAGSWFGYARDRSVALSAGPLAEQLHRCRTPLEAARLMDCEVSLGQVVGGRWRIARSTLPHRVGAMLAPRLDPDGNRLRVRDTDLYGRQGDRYLDVVAVEGPRQLLAVTEDVAPSRPAAHRPALSE
ncbi:hypothetical protein [Kitasatospora sp. NPDC093102]|uniref:hypothetical protein n=1 Tax=Kitasatospora sp. NPDC093102 TaxID=3155069 RepID=UPI00342B5503